MWLGWCHREEYYTRRSLSGSLSFHTADALTPILGPSFDHRTKFSDIDSVRKCHFEQKFCYAESTFLHHVLAKSSGTFSVDPCTSEVLTLASTASPPIRLLIIGNR